MPMFIIEKHDGPQGITVIRRGSHHIPQRTRPGHLECNVLAEQMAQTLQILQYLNSEYIPDVELIVHVFLFFFLFFFQKVTNTKLLIWHQGSFCSACAT